MPSPRSPRSGVSPSGDGPSERAKMFTLRGSNMTVPMLEFVPQQFCMVSAAMAFFVCFLGTFFFLKCTYSGGLGSHELSSFSVKRELTQLSQICEGRRWLTTIVAFEILEGSLKYDVFADRVLEESLKHWDLLERERGVYAFIQQRKLN